MSEWQTMESAPRDGSRILATDGEWVDVVHYSSRTLPEYCWVDEQGSGSGSSFLKFWQPLPEPPK